MRFAIVDFVDHCVAAGLIASRGARVGRREIESSLDGCLRSGDDVVSRSEMQKQSLVYFTLV